MFYWPREGDAEMSKGKAPLLLIGGAALLILMSKKKGVSNIQVVKSAKSNAKAVKRVEPETMAAIEVV